MCVVCGCSNTENHAVPEPAVSSALTSATGDLHYGTGLAKASVPGLSPGRMVKLEADVLGANQRQADLNRAHFTALTTWFPALARARPHCCAQRLPPCVSVHLTCPWP